MSPGAATPWGESIGPEDPPSLLGISIRRAIRSGRLYLVLGVGLTVFLALVLIASSPALFGFAFPLELPMFAVLGSSGALQVYVNDRTRGVFEYLLAYGVRPWTIFSNGVVATAALTAVVFAAGSGVAFTVFLWAGGTMTPDLIATLLAYSLPMSFATSVFTAMAGMIWSSLSTPREGINGPTGIAPLVGVAPVLVVLVIAGALPRPEFYYVTSASAALLFLAVVGIVLLSDRFLRRERFLSQL